MREHFQTNLLNNIYDQVLRFPCKMNVAEALEYAENCGDNVMSEQNITILKEFIRIVHNFLQIRQYSIISKFKKFTFSANLTKF